MPTFAGFEHREVAGVPLLFLRDSRFKTFRFGFYLRRPLDETAAARSLLPPLLLRGTEASPSRPDLARRMHQLYGAMVQPYSSKVGESHLICFALDAIAGRNLPGQPNQFGDALGLLAELATKPCLDGDAFPNEVFDLEREQTLNMIRTQIDDKGSYAAEQAVRRACHGEPMAIPEHGGLDAVAALTARDPVAALSDFVRHGQAWVVAAGDIPEEAALQAHLESFLAALPSRSEEAVEVPIDLPARPATRTVEHADLRQSKLVMVFRAPRLSDAAERVGRGLFISMFGGGPSSRLFAEVREKRSLAYYASASLDRHKGLVMVQVGLDGSAVEQASAAILEQLQELQAGKFDDGELETARQKMLAGLRGLDDSIAQRARFTNDQWLQGVDRTPDDLAALVRDASRDHVVTGGHGIWLDHSFVLTDDQGVTA